MSYPPDHSHSPPHEQQQQPYQPSPNPFLEESAGRRTASPLAHGQLDPAPAAGRRYQLSDSYAGSMQTLPTDKIGREHV